MNHECFRTRRRRCAGFVALTGAVLTAVVHAVPLSAQLRTCVDGAAITTGEATTWPDPLDRLVSLDTSTIPLRAALDRLADASVVRVSYSSDAIAVEEVVCASFTDIPLGDALRGLVRAAAHGSGASSIHPIAAAPDHVVLAPARVAELPSQLAPSLDRVIPLESIVVTGTATSMSARGLAFSADLVESREIGGARNLGDLLSVAVPGLWAWASSPADLGIRFASLRGASSFAESSPKVYLDGIQVANPLALGRIVPESIERIEVIRGPQGAALHGADAINGVINIFTRRGVPEPGAPRLQLRSGAGLVSTDYSPGTVISQDHVLFGWLGSGSRTATFTLGGGATGELLPGAGSRYLAFSGSGRSVGAASILSGTARIDFASARSGMNPWLDPSEPVAGGRMSRLSGYDGADGRSMLQYTFGTTLNFTGADRWTHTLVAGIDGFRRTGTDPSRVIGAFGQPRAGWYGGETGDRLSLRGTSVFDAVSTPDFAARLSLVGEHTRLRESTPLRSHRALSDGDEFAAAQPDRIDLPELVTNQSTSGVAVHANGSFRERLYIDAGVRFETNDGYGYASGSDLHALPRVGTALVLDGDRITATLRTAYGKGIRSPHSALSGVLSPGVRPPASAYLLPPETQSGIEAGIEVEIEDRLTLGLTRFDQLASGLIQVVPAPANVRPSADDRSALLLQNVGRISNTGWEAEVSGEFGRFVLDATFATVDSRVRRLASGYDGDLRIGDRMLQVPATTASFSTSWSDVRWSASLTAAKAWSWINYDHERLASLSRSAGSSEGGAGGSSLRDTWREYDGALRVNAGTSIALRPGLSLLLGVENLFDGQRGELNTLAIVPGRSYTVGLHAAF